jgi:hypothetical protein
LGKIVQYEADEDGEAVRKIYPPLLMDGGYVGAQRIIGAAALVTRRKLSGGELSAGDSLFNDDVVHDRVLVEDYFGRVKTKYPLLHDKYRGTSRNCQFGSSLEWSPRTSTSRSTRCVAALAREMLSSKCRAGGAFIV